MASACSSGREIITILSPAWTLEPPRGIVISPLRTIPPKTIVSGRSISLISLPQASESGETIVY